MEHESSELGVAGSSPAGRASPHLAVTSCHLIPSTFDRIQIVVMDRRSSRWLLKVITCAALATSQSLIAEQVPVRHIEGTAFGFLVLRDIDGRAIAYGQLQQVVKGGQVIDDLKFSFKDGSLYEEITKFTQHENFRLVSDHVVQKGPAFKEEMESWLDSTTGQVTVRSMSEGKTKTSKKALKVPLDAANGMLFTLTKNIDPSRTTTVSMVAVSTRPRVVKLEISPQPEKVFSLGFVAHKAQHYLVKVKIGGVTGAVAPLVGKQPPDIHIWLVKSEAPTFVESEGPLSQDGPVWRIELAAPEPETPKPTVSDSKP